MKRNFVFFLSINFTLYFNLKISILFSSLLFLSFKPNTLLWLPQLTNLFHKLHFPWALRCWTFAKYMWVLHLIKQIVYMKKGTYGERAHMLCRLGFFVIGLVCVMRGGCGCLSFCHFLFIYSHCVCVYVILCPIPLSQVFWQNPCDICLIWNI